MLCKPDNFWTNPHCDAYFRLYIRHRAEGHLFLTPEAAEVFLYVHCRSLSDSSLGSELLLIRPHETSACKQPLLLVSLSRLRPETITVSVVPHKGEEEPKLKQQVSTM